LNIEAKVYAALGAAVVRDEALSGGCVGDVRKLTLTDGRTVVAKLGPGAALEGQMLRYLAERSRLPVPAVYHAGNGLLLMAFISTSGSLDAAAESDAAEHLGALHAITAPTFGFAYDTLIGGLAQPNPMTASWRAFFRDHRLLFMAREALTAEHLPARTMTRIEILAGRLDRWIGATTEPSLIHGDMWNGNILCRSGRVAGFVDPAIYFADAEIELAFSTLFGTFNTAFFRRYGELRPIAPGFFEERCDLYNLYPLLVHVRLFGGTYVGQVERTLTKLGV